jgi:Ca2+-binding EF-hand superfamily protein
MLNALSGIARDQGVTALWKGTVVSMARSVLATSSSLAVNSRLKDISPLPALGAPLIVNDAACAMGAAFFAVAAMNPADVVRTRLYAQPIGPDGKGALYSGFVDCGKQILKNDGPRGFWRGAVPHFLRFGPHTVISFTAIGVIRRAIRDQKQAALRRQWEKEQLDAFDRFDVNADGSLDLDEVVQVVKRVYPYVGVQETLHSEAEWAEGVKKDAAEAFAKADVDNSGRIEKDEWLELSRKLRSLARERTIDLLFETLDADKSGVLQEDELAEALARMPGDRGQRSLARDPERLKAIAHRMMARFDDDGSGNLNIAEWRSLVRPVLEQLLPWRTPFRGCSVALALESFVTATLCHACAQCSKVSEDDLATGLDAVMTAWAREAGTDFTAMGQFQD